MTAPFDLSETDRLLSTTRAVRRRLDLERPVEREVILDCIRLSQQAEYRPSSALSQSGDHPQQLADASQSQDQITTNDIHVRYPAALLSQLI